MNVPVLLYVPSLTLESPAPQPTQRQPLFSGSYPAANDDTLTV